LTAVEEAGFPGNVKLPGGSPDIVGVIRWSLNPYRVARAVIRGGHGRLETALERLRDGGYRIWNDVRIGAEVVDHVIVGPSGVFALQCSQAGRFEPFRNAIGPGRARIERRVGAAVWQASKETVALQRRLRQAHLRLAVQGIVILTGARPGRGPMDLGKVAVLAPEELLRFVLGWEHPLTAAQQFIAAGLIQGDRRLSWHPSIGR
jgi:hypothetical protein